MEKVNHSDHWRPKVNEKFDFVRNSNWGKAQHTVAMEQNLDEFGLKNANETNVTLHLLKQAI